MLAVKLTRKRKRRLRKKRRRAKARKERKAVAKAKKKILLKHSGINRTNLEKFVRKSDFTKYYRYVDSSYNSYWFGKFINMFIKAGKKRRAINIVHGVFNSLKYTYNVSVFGVLMATLHKLRPVFKLRKYKVRKGREIKEYPVLTKLNLLYTYVLIRIKKGIQKDFNLSYGQGVRSFMSVMRNNLREYITKPRKHKLIKERRLYVNYSVHFMLNRRFNRKKRKRL